MTFGFSAQDATFPLALAPPECPSRYHSFRLNHSEVQRHMFQSCFLFFFERMACLNM